MVLVLTLSRMMVYILGKNFKRKIATDVFNAFCHLDFLPITLVKEDTVSSVRSLEMMIPRLMRDS